MRKCVTCGVEFIVTKKHPANIACGRSCGCKYAARARRGRRLDDDIAARLHQTARAAHLVRRLQQFPQLEDRGWLYNQYWKKELSLDEIAALAGCAAATVHRALIRKSVPLRFEAPPRLRAKQLGRKPKKKNFRAHAPPGQATRRKEIIEIRGYKCQWCGCKKNIDMHHIKPYTFSQSHADENLLLLCKRCHAKADMIFQQLARACFASDGYPGLLDAVSTLGSHIQSTSSKFADL